MFLENNIIVHRYNTLCTKKYLTLEGGAQMQITNVRLNKTLNSESPKGLFIAMPSREKANGEHKDIAHPINQETRQKIQDAIFKEYEAVQAESGNEAEASTEE